MKKRILALLAAGTLLLTGCGAQNAAQSDAANSGSDDLQHLTVVLDWYPNACMHSCTKRRRRVTSQRKVWMWISSLRQA